MLGKYQMEWNKKHDIGIHARNIIRIGKKGYVKTSTKNLQMILMRCGVVGATPLLHGVSQIIM